MIRIQKKILVDEHGAPKEAIIPWKQFCEIAETLGFDLDEEATTDFRAARRDWRQRPIRSSSRISGRAAVFTSSCPAPKNRICLHSHKNVVTLCL